MTRAALDEYIEPFLDYVEAELTLSKRDSSLTSLLESRLSAFVEEKISNSLPDVADSIRRIAAEFSRPEGEVHWQNIGNSCRDVLKLAVRRIIEQGDLSLPSNIPVGNVKGVIQLLIDHAGTSDSRGTIVKLLGAVWDHAQTVTHRDATTKEEASRLFVWTSLGLYELLLVWHPRRC
jgi:hypothetical protein